MPQSQPIIVIGAGPVGLAAALLLNARGHEVTVHEAKESLEFSSENSYPIGVNLRGQETLRRIDPALLERLRAEGEIVRAFNIYSGRRRVASLESGTLIATTRAFLTQILYERAVATDGITIELGHALGSLDLASRTLTFARSGGDEVTVDATDARVLAADGVRSAARRSVTEQVPGFEPRIGDWGVRFRMAYSQPGSSAEGLDPSIHHIFADKGIYTSTLKDGVWGVAVTAIEGDDSDELLLSTDASEENIRGLQAHLARYAPLAAPLLTHDDCAAYFSRQPFGGAVVICPRVAFDEWLLLMGDAAHGVLPPTGEGVNSGLEDAAILAERADSATWFADYEALRLPDLHALGEYAWTLKDNLGSTDPARGAANVILRIADTVAAKLGLPSAQVEARLFGPDAGRTPYRDAIGPWQRQRRALFPLAYGASSGVRDLARAVRRESRPVGSTVPQHLIPPKGNPMKITIIGGSQGTGRALAELAQRSGHAVTVLSRSGVDMDGVRVLKGDANDLATVRGAIEGADAVVVTVGGSKDASRARTGVTRAVIAAMREAGVDRLVVQTSLGAGDSAQRLAFPMNRIAPVILAKPLADHDAQEDLVRTSGLRWTIVRPSGLTDQPATGQWHALRDGEPGTVKGRISRGDVAGCMLDALQDDSTIGVHLGVGGA